MAEPGKRPPVPPGPYLVVGLGRAGVAAVGALCDLHGAAQVSACDDTPAALESEAAVRLRDRGVAIGRSGEARIPRRGCVVKSPGVPFEAPVIARALDAGATVIDELELGWRLGRAPLVGVTGTNGKSTVCSLVAAAVDAGPFAGNAEFGPPLSQAAPRARAPIVCEVSSYQLEGCPELLPELAVLTNRRVEHLQRHGSIEAYAACKRRLFVRDAGAVGVAVVNADDELGRRLAEEVGERGGEVLRFGRGREAEFRLRNAGWTVTDASLEADTPDGPVTIRHRLPGPHNAENVLAAAAACRALGHGWDRILTAFASAPVVPGRFEAIDEGQPFDVVVDFAHTPDAIEAVIGAARAVAGKRDGRVLVAMSVAGHRMVELNAPIGAACARLADAVIVTAGSLRSGSPATTIEPLFAGARAAAAAPVQMIRDRRDAIRALLSMAEAGDVALVLGRGARPWLSGERAGEGRPFDDRVVVREELRRLGR